MTVRILNACALLACVAAAQDSHRRPGLWETSITTQTPGMAIPDDRLAKLTPEQRAAFQAAMSSRMGAGAQPLITKTCETAETLKTEDNYGQYKNTSCKITPVSSSGSQRVMHMSCETATIKTEAKIIIENSDPEHFSGTIVTQINSQGRNMESSQKLSGKWISSDCGDVKPRVYSK
jgi:hypothetical protein